jgi:hypothetical protein
MGFELTTFQLVAQCINHYATTWVLFYHIQRQWYHVNVDLI